MVKMIQCGNCQIRYLTENIQYISLLCTSSDKNTQHYVTVSGIQQLHTSFKNFLSTLQFKSARNIPIGKLKPVSLAHYSKSNNWQIWINEPSQRILTCVIWFWRVQGSSVGLHRIWHTIIFWLCTLIIFILKAERIKWSYPLYGKEMTVDTKSFVCFGLCFSFCLCAVITTACSGFCLTPSWTQNDLGCFWYLWNCLWPTGVHYHLAIQAETAQLTVVRSCFFVFVIYFADRRSF